MPFTNINFPQPKPISRPRLPEQDVPIESIIENRSYSPEADVIKQVVNILSTAIQQKTEKNKRGKSALNYGNAIVEPKLDEKTGRESEETINQRQAVVHILSQLPVEKQAELAPKLAPQTTRVLHQDGTITETTGGLFRRDKIIKANESSNPNIPIFYTDRVSGITRDAKGSIVTEIPKNSKVIPLDINEGAQSKYALTKKNINGVLNTVNRLEQAWDKISQEGKTGMSITTLPAAVSGKLEQDPDVKTYLSLKNALITYIGRNEGEDVGNFAVGEQKNYEGRMPSLYARDDTAKSLFNSIRTLALDKLEETDKAYKAFGLTEKSNRKKDSDFTEDDAINKGWVKP